jgi:hypothetical protein
VTEGGGRGDLALVLHILCLVEAIATRYQLELVGAAGHAWGVGDAVRRGASGDGR